MENYIFISGASSGIGKACAERFAREGYNLILNARRREILENLKQELQNIYPVKIELLVFDVRDEREVINQVNQLDENIKNKIIALINNAGLALGRDSIENGVSEDWDRLIDTNVKGLLYVSKAVMPLMISNGRGHIFNIASIAGKEVYPEGNVYCASKHAVDALSRAMRIDLVKHGIKVTNIAPGAVETEFSLVRFKGDQQIAKGVYNGFTPLSGPDVADALFYAFQVPSHVNINDLVIMPAQQASATQIFRS